MTLAPVGSSELLAELGEEFQQLSDDLDMVDQNAASVLVAITKAVQTQACITKGRIISLFRDEHPELTGRWHEFLRLKGLVQQSVNMWINAYLCYEESKDSIDLNQFSALTLSRLYSGTSTATRQAVLSGGECTNESVNKLVSDPVEKLLKAEEDLEKAKAKKAEREAAFAEYDGSRNTINPEYNQLKTDKNVSVKSVTRLEAKIKKLKEQIQLEQDKATAAEAAKDKAEEQLNKVMFDEKTSKELQVKRVGYNLQNMVPQILADSQRYISEKGSYPEDLRFHIDQQLIQLLTYLQSHYGSENRR